MRSRKLCATIWHMQRKVDSFWHQIPQTVVVGKWFLKQLPLVIDQGKSWLRNADFSRHSIESRKWISRLDHFKSGIRLVNSS